MVSGVPGNDCRRCRQFSGRGAGDCFLPSLTSRDQPTITKLAAQSGTFFGTGTKVGQPTVIGATVTRPIARFIEEKLEAPPGFEPGGGGFADFVGLAKLLTRLARWSLHTSLFTRCSSAIGRKSDATLVAARESAPRATVRRGCRAAGSRVSQLGVPNAATIAAALGVEGSTGSAFTMARRCSEARGPVGDL